MTSKSAAPVVAPSEIPEEPRTSRPCRLAELGLVPYHAAWELQSHLWSLRVERQIEDTLVLLEHPHVFTQGRNGDERNILLDETGLAKAGAIYVRSDRGGDATYHGPGQIVAYPILDLRTRGSDVRQYVHDLEEVVIRTAATYGVDAGRVAGLPGVWVGVGKLAAIGVKVSRWVTRHGFALNVNPNLDYFGMIVPCGLVGRQATSLSALLGRPVDVADAQTRVLASFRSVFACEFEADPAPRQWLESWRAGAANTVSTNLGGAE